MTRIKVKARTVPEAQNQFCRSALLAILWGIVYNRGRKLEIGVNTVRYCPRCQRIEEKEIERCPVSHKQLKRNIEENDPVFLLETSILESERVEAALDDEGIPYASRTPKKEPSATIITGNKNAGVYLYVPFQVWEKAKDIAIGIGAMQPAEEDTQQLQEKSRTIEKKGEEFEEMSRSKRLIVRIVSVILFILVIWAVVAGTDFVMNLIKGLW